MQIYHFFRHKNPVQPNNVEEFQPSYAEQITNDRLESVSDAYLIPQKFLAGVVNEALKSGKWSFKLVVIGRQRMRI